MLTIKIIHSKKDLFVPFSLALYDNNELLYTSFHKNKEELNEEVEAIKVLSTNILIKEEIAE